MSWTTFWMKSHSGPASTKCPECGKDLPARNSRCSGCSLDLKFLGYVMRFLTGDYPEAECRLTFLKTGEVPHLVDKIWITRLRDKSDLEHDSGAPDHGLAPKPFLGAPNLLVRGFLVATNRRVIISDDDDITGISWHKVRHFDLDAKSVRIFYDGKRSGDVLHMEDTRPLWWLYYSKIHLEPHAGLLKSSDLSDAPDDQRIGILSILTDMEKARKRAIPKTLVGKDSMALFLWIMMWMILMPPLGFRLVFLVRGLPAYLKGGLVLFGLSSVCSWIFMVRALTRSLGLI